MFWINYKYRIVSSLRSKEMFLWMMIFPCMLATLFKVAFSGLDAEGRLEPIPVAVVVEEAPENQMFLSVMNHMSKGEEALFILAKMDEAGAKELLDDGEIDGIFYCRDGVPSMEIAENGMNATIMKSFLDMYLQKSDLIVRAIQENSGQMPDLDSLLETKSFTRERSLTKNQPSATVNYFYTLIAMTCLYGAMQGIQSGMVLQANQSPLGARRMLSPVKRMQLVAGDLLGGVTIQYGCVLVVLIYVGLILGGRFGGKIPQILLAALAGTLTGTGMGGVIGTVTKQKENVKTGIMIAVTMVCCYCAGMMTFGVNHIIEKNVPILAWLNPAARISDAFYCLYYYDTYEMFYQNVGILFLMAAVLCTVTVLLLRRQRYENI